MVRTPCLLGSIFLAKPSGGGRDVQEQKAEPLASSEEQEGSVSLETPEHQSPDTEWQDLASCLKKLQSHVEALADEPAPPSKTAEVFGGFFHDRRKPEQPEKRGTVQLGGVSITYPLLGCLLAKEVPPVESESEAKTLGVSPGPEALRSQAEVLLAEADGARQEARICEGGIQHDVNYEYESMDSNKDDEKRVPQFSGKLDEYRDYRKRALLYFNGLEDSKQNLAAPRLIANLGGAAFECFRERDPAEFRNTRGVAQLLAVLDERFQFTPEQELSDKLEDLLFRLRRRRGEESTSFVTRFETSLAKVEELITEEQRAERRRQADLQRSEYRRASLDYMVARRQHELTVAGLATGQEPPAEPIAPAPPADLPQLQPFRFPEVVKGFIFLRHIGISLQTRASLLRSSGGSLRYDRVSDLLRRTELDALVASRAQATSHGHGFFADAPEDEDPFEESEGDELEEDYDDDDEYGAFAEGEETELTEEDAVEDEDGDEYSVAMMGYLEARKRLLNLKKARGFKEPVDGHASGKGGHGGTERDRREHRDRDRGRATTPSRRPDFSWRDKEQRRSSQKSYAGRRPRTPPPTRGSGLKGGGKTKTKNKGKGHRASSSSRRGEPAGSQYLGMAISEPKVELDFRPEFSYMAYATAATSTSTSSARPRTSQEFSYVSRQSFSHLESFVEECLTLDRLMGLEPASPESAESCCLVTPPGYAILDTGCTSTLVGDENERLWSAELERKTGGALKPEQGDSDVKFEGINGETRASYRVKYPVRIGPRDGFIQAAVIPGKAPFLLSIQALRAMRAKLDCEHDVLEVPGIGKVPLETNAVGHYLLPLLDFSSGHAFASAEAGLGPDSELVIDEAVSRSDGYAIGALVRLAKVKAAQIGYRSKVFRRPPARLERAWVLVMPLPPVGVCACLVKPDTIQPPRYAHCSHHMIEAFGNATGNTFHCSHCRLKCRECKGRVARVVKATGEIQYSHRKDCAVTPIPGPSAFSLLADGDLVQVEGAPETIDKGGLITYPFSVRRVAMLPSKLEQLKENDRRASEFSLETVNQKPAEQEIKTLKTSGALTGATSTGYPVGHPHPKVPQPAAAAASSSPELGAVMTAVREMLAKEYAAIPQKPDVTMSGESSIVAQIMELEGQAMELMTRAAHLRQQIGMPVNRFLAGPTAQATSQGSTPSSQWPGVSSTAVSDPDASDAWEALRLR
ncbi:hypothetical protein AK812_SmicGene5122 [Symbiodinium microadriaticum]|uniref:Uncharacterized protein n=1 Tax=Symbiodinium microadriaticum TaxID=2951 RepID=A0A1Q9EUF3_SYMMI|nr:hypothetical protein AK812_SmicGene5122 [Symbiodinium microadriaticum]